MLLIQEPPLQVLPTLAARIGLNEAIVLQQLHYWLLKNKDNPANRKRGMVWCWNSYEQWQEAFPFWSARTVRRTFKALEAAGLIKRNSFNRLSIDRTSWYTIDYAEVAKLAGSEVANLATPCGHLGHTHVASLAASVPETTAETTPETNPAFPPQPASPPELQKTGREKTKPKNEKPKNENLKPDQMNLAETLKANREKKGLQPKSAATKTSALVMVWKEEMGMKEGTTCGPLTQKQAGQLGQLLRQAGADADAIVRWVIPHWTTFALQASIESGEKTRPAAPHVGYLLAHWKTARGMLQAPEQAKATALPVVDLPPIPVVPAEDKLTLEQLLEIEKDAGLHD